jgi:hypothetical protein
VSGLVSEKTGWSQNLFQTFGAIETIELTLDTGLPVIRGVEVRFGLNVISQEILAAPREYLPRLSFAFSKD